MAVLLIPWCQEGYPPAAFQDSEKEFWETVNSWKDSDEFCLRARYKLFQNMCHSIYPDAETKELLNTFRFEYATKWTARNPPPEAMSTEANFQQGIVRENIQDVIAKANLEGYKEDFVELLRYDLNMQNLTSSTVDPTASVTSSSIAKYSSEDAVTKRFKDEFGDKHFIITGSRDEEMDFTHFRPQDFVPTVLQNPKDLPDAIEELGDEQNDVYRFVKEQVIRKQDFQPYLNLVLNGAAGTGKSRLIQVLMKLFNCVVTATSNMAATILELAYTTHKALKLYNDIIKKVSDEYKSHERKNLWLHPLSADKKAELAAAYENVDIIIIDEISLFGQIKLGHVVQRLREIFEETHLRAPVVMLVGDLNQIEPVADPSILSTPDKDNDHACMQAGRTFWEECHKMALTRQVRKGYICQYHIQLTHLLRHEVPNSVPVPITCFDSTSQTFSKTNQQRSLGFPKVGSTSSRSSFDGYGQYAAGDRQ
ncbi:AAA family ATPase [Flagellimonas marinaquae]